MKLKFFQIPVGDSHAAVNELNAFVTCIRMPHVCVLLVCKVFNPFKM